MLVHTSHVVTCSQHPCVLRGDGRKGRDWVAAASILGDVRTASVGSLALPTVARMITALLPIRQAGSCRRYKYLMILTVSTSALDAALMATGYDVSAFPRKGYYSLDDVRCVMARARFPISAIKLDLAATSAALCEIFNNDTRAMSLSGSWHRWAMTFPNDDDAVWWLMRYG